MTNPEKRFDRSPLETIIGFRLRLAQVDVFRDFIEAFAALDLRPVEFSILRLVAANPGVHQGQLAETLGVQRANMVALIKGLARRGLLDRGTVPGDRRRIALTLTEKGGGFVIEMNAIWACHEQRFVERLGGPAERDRLIALLDRISAVPGDGSEESGG